MHNLYIRESKKNRIEVVFKSNGKIKCKVYYHKGFYDERNELITQATKYAHEVAQDYNGKVINLIERTVKTY